MAPLIDHEAVKVYLGIPEANTDNDGDLDLAAEAAEASLAGLCGRETFLVREYARTVTLRPFQTALVLPVRPVVGRPVVQWGAMRRAFIGADVDVTANTISVVDHGLTTGDGPLRVIVLSGIAPAGLAITTDYWAISVTVNTFKLASSAVLAAAGTAVDITANTGVTRAAIVGPVVEYPLDPVGGILRFVNAPPWCGGLLLTVVWQAGLCTSDSDAPADLLAWITKQAAFEFREMGPSGRLGNSGQEKQTGVRSQYSTKEFARGVVAGMQRYVLRGVY